MRVVFAGTPEAAVPSLHAVLASRHEVLAVLTRPPARSGRGRRLAPGPVAAVAEGAGVPVLTPPRPGDPDFLATLDALAPDCCPVVAYGALIPKAALDLPRHGWVNLHFSLLPAWRGAAPVQHAVLAGDEVTGASTFRLEEGLDTGPVFGVSTEPVRPGDTSGELLARLAGSGAALLVATLDGIEDGTLVPRPQAGEGVSSAPKLGVDDARIDWDTPALHVDRLIRACTPAPGAWTTLRGERLKVGPVRILPDDTGGDPPAAGALGPGVLAADRSSVRVGTGNGTVVLGEVQPPGRRAVPAPDWARGRRLSEGDRLGS